MFIHGQEFSCGILGRIRRTVSRNPTLSRSALSRRVCEWLNWRSANGKLKEVGCRVALLKLYRRGAINLPVGGQRPPRKGTGRRVGSVVGKLSSIRCRFSSLGLVALVKVGSSDSQVSRIWNALMDRYHYLGSGPLCGSQMRYLIKSPKHGWLGGLSFSASALRLESRDRWIGWEAGARRQHLAKVVCNSRFLILPHVHVPHLASHALSLAVKRVGSDWVQRYGYEPVLLETFVDRSRFTGTSYRAANWTHVGRTRGRGRQDRENRFSKSVKDVYLFPLHRDACKILCDGPPKAVVERPWPEKALDWADEEFGTASLGDERLEKRLLTITRDLYARPQANIPQACQGRAKTRAAYRFFEHSESTMDNILASHYDATLSRVAKEKVVLAVQDTTSLNYSTHPATSDLGLIGSKKEGLIGLLVHDTMAFNLEGTPLGLLDVQCWSRNPEDFGKKHLRHELPIEQKESNKWLKSFRQVAQAQRRSPDTTLVSVGDREADIYELFELALRDFSSPKLLVRAEHDRLLSDGQGHLLEAVAQGGLAGIQVIRVPRNKNCPAREASLEVRFAEVTLKPPHRKLALGELTIWAVLAQEMDTPSGVAPLKWMLLTTVEITRFEDAIEKLAWYTQRWGIEVYHRTLKSGCKIEERQLGSADKIEACMAIDMVVAWRIFHLTKLGRETPIVPCSVFFAEHEWKALVSFIHRDPKSIDKEPTLREAIRMVAGLGGFLGRKCDGNPGTKSMWLGLQRLGDIAATWKYIMENHVPYILSHPPPVSSNPTYG